jgi:cytochrome P450
MTSTLTLAPLDERLTLLLDSNPEAMRDPFPLWRELRETAPVHRHRDVVLVSSYAEVKRQLRDHVGLSSRAGIEGSLFAANRSRLDDRQRRAQSEIAEFEALYLSRSDGEQHTRLRTIAHRAFTPRRIADMRAMLTRCTDDLLAGVATDEPIDLRATLAYPLPMLAICGMLGVPDGERAMIHEWSGRLGRNRGGDDPQAVMAAWDAMGQFRRYVEEILVPLRRSEPSSDLVSALLEAEQGERLTDRELTAMFVVLLFAGHETTTNLIATGLRELLLHPQQWERLRADPSLILAAVEELLRWVSPVQWTARVAATDLRIGELDVSRGEAVFLVVAAANRDPEEFHDPERLDVGRADSKAHLSLGFGAHFCLGNALARLEAAIALTTIATRFPDIRLAGEPAGWEGNTMLRRLSDLPVVLGAERG